MAAQPSPRRGHAGIKAILDDMVAVLPPENTNNQAYRGCHTTYGLMTRCIQNAEQGDDPDKQYQELQKLEDTLRKRLHALKAKKGIPEKMQNCLNELRDAMTDALEQGVDEDFMIKAHEAMIGIPEQTLAEKEKKVPQKYVTEEKYKKVWTMLREERTKNEKLNGENNQLVMRLKAVEAERDRLLRRDSAQQGPASQWPSSEWN